ncbi:bifunctional 4-hydroxy-2-oxoglutarate aldolase/2-dehydro-3-deoxy-phosphogluconate aldolase [Candidatus Epulonipiscium viviparus]|uniref:bifunctional 4-hydroxy-2-oxoglutarate aldolase/2-dehydro-3-deoxy-phosphogluconate aldolase n=1 Tax=Candidatus Epulonipiscium viviparus TaxID=420336 RepID=UPI0027380FBB|nr:bifunctional 4-hydroxy-2-oxoglutarate aldolase/2-dehydro-3-deoxy-phosphogluconate aldolase [Candidatus Epulopiscium viviparus]
MKQNVIDSILEHKIIAIVRGVAESDIVATAGALAEGGIKLLEITFNQKDPNTLKNTATLIKMVNEKYGDQICIGAGTVMNPEQATAAFEAGAKYFISPNTNIAVIHTTNNLGAVSIPGALTPTESQAAFEAGADFVKLFPAGDLGIGYIKSVCAPLNHIPFLAVGGINSENVADYLKTGIKGVGVGGNLVDLKAIANKDFKKLTALAKEYIANC